MPSPVLDAAERYLARLAAEEASATSRLVSNYLYSWKRLESMLMALLLDIGDRDLTRGQLIRMTRYKSLMKQIVAELQGLQTLTANEIEIASMFGINLGSRGAIEMLNGYVGTTIKWHRLNPEAIKMLLSFLAPDGPLYERLSMLAPSAAEAVAAAIVEGVTLGFNPRKIARMVQDAFGRGLADALRFVRTVQLWSYREANRATFIANQNVIEGWWWHCAKDDRTCMSCIAMDGTFHELSETLNDHFNGRCAMVPAVKGFDSPLDMNAKDWFAGLSEAQQRQMMGPGKYDAWKAGQFDLADMTTVHTDDVYGDMRSEAALWELLGAEQPIRMSQED